VGGAITLPTGAFEAVLGGVLLVSAVRMLLDARRPASAHDEMAPTMPAKPWLTPAALGALGGGVGLLSGLTGVGGGVFLTPALLAVAHLSLRAAAGVAAEVTHLNVTSIRKAQPADVLALSQALRGR
jgi:uncharacterized membrane protein YfcA